MRFAPLAFQTTPDDWVAVLDNSGGSPGSTGRLIGFISHYSSRWYSWNLAGLSGDSFHLDYTGDYKTRKEAVYSLQEQYNELKH